MADLLPPNATQLERILAAANARLGDIPVDLRWLVRPDDCPLEFLPWLAQSLSVDSWDMNWSEAQKRDTIKASLGVHRVKGTIGAVRRALSALGIEARLQEWFNQIPQGKPYTYRLLLDIDQVGIDQLTMRRVIQVVDDTKNLRSHLDTIRLRAVSKVRRRVAAVTGTGHQVTLRFQAAPLVINENSLVG